MRGNITRRGKSSWRLKFDVGTDGLGRRQTRYVTVKGKRQDAERELTKILRSIDEGSLPEPTKITVADYFDAWLNGAHGLAPKTAERYRQLVDQQIVPHLGRVVLQKLKPAQIASWHGTLLSRGGQGGRALSSATVRQAHRILHRGLARAVELEMISRNAASVIPPPSADYRETESLRADQVGSILVTLADHMLFPIATLALGTGMRRGEILALRWSDLDLEARVVRIERSLEETKAGLRFKPPKNQHSRRTISIPESAVSALREHRNKQLEQRVALGLGRPGRDALVFSTAEGTPISPGRISGAWRDIVRGRKLPKVSFHALRHTHASALIASGLDVVSVSRRLGHASPVVTLSVYAHLFHQDDRAAANAIEIVMRTPPAR